MTQRERREKRLRSEREACLREFWAGRGRLKDYRTGESYDLFETIVISWALRVYRKRERYPRQWKIVKQLIEAGIAPVLRDHPEP